MPSAKLTSKGQITIPKEVRAALGLHTGDRLAFRLHDDGTVVVEAEKVSLSSLRGAVRTKVKGVTVEAMNDAIRRAGGRG
jgi:AbrB family looped-hinge helix DNA binding protein